MTAYTPLYIKGFETGLVQSREEFILPNDAFPILENAFVWRERIKRKQGCKLLGRLRRVLTAYSEGPSQASVWNFNILTETGYVLTTDNANPGKVTTRYPHNLVNGDTVVITNVVGAVGYNNVLFTITVVDDINFTVGANAAAFGAYISGGTFISNRSLHGAGTEPDSEIEPGSVLFTIGATTFTDNGLGILVGSVVGNSGTINYITGAISITHTAGVGVVTTLDFNYFPGLPVMGLPSRELNDINNEQLVPFDTKYAYKFTGGFDEFLPGTDWTGNNSDFFWATNYWVTPAPNNQKLFWVTNFSGPSGDPIRYTNGVPGTNWVNFAPLLENAPSVKRLQQCLALLPFRGRLVAFNTWEGDTLASSVQYRQRIRWAAIGNPITEVSPLFPLAGDVSADAWKDVIRGKGGFLDIPTSEDIIAVGFVRDNLVIYTERSTWQLRYTGRSIAPFQIEKVNSELGAESTFSAVQFDTSLVGIGDKGVVECDSFQSKRIDIKIPDLVFEFNNANDGPKRVHGIRDFEQRLAYWTYPYSPANLPGGIFPNRRLVYNYENDSWAIFSDSLTTFGTFQAVLSLKWRDFRGDPEGTWENQNYQWVTKQSAFPSIVGGNQQGFVEYLDFQVTNDISLSITAITGNTTTPTVITSPNHNLQTDQVISVFDIPAGTPFATSLNGNIFNVVVVDANNFQLWKYNPLLDAFDIPQVDAPATYIGGGKIAIRDNFSIVSKKFNFLDDGENIQLGFIDILMNSTSNGGISLKCYLDYNDDSPVNILPQNSQSDSFFNSTVETTTTAGLIGSKVFKRVICPVRGAFITLEWTLSNSQMVGIEQTQDVQIDSQILYIRKAGRQLPVGV